MFKTLNIGHLDSVPASVHSLLHSALRKRAIVLCHEMHAQSRLEGRLKLKMMHGDQSCAGSGFSKEFIEQLREKELRDAFMSDQVRIRIALLIRALREHRQWSQAELGRRAGEPQSAISRLEDPDDGGLTLESLLKVAAAFDLPLLVDMPEWEDWFKKMSDSSCGALCRRGFDLNRLSQLS